jgi:tetratricopeptide (TPR) repeat protein
MVISFVKIRLQVRVWVTSLLSLSIAAFWLAGSVAVVPADADSQSAITAQVLNDSNMSGLLLQQADALQQKNPRDPRAYATRVAIYLQRGWLDQAIGELNTLCSLGPDDGRLFELKATAEAIRGDFNSAIKDISKAISTNPQVARYYCCRGTILVLANRLTEATADCQKALALDSRLAPAYENLAEIQYRMRNYHIVIEYCNSAISRAPSFADAYYYRALAYEKMNNLPQAAQDRAKARELGFTEPTIFKNKYI